MSETQLVDWGTTHEDTLYVCETLDRIQALRPGADDYAADRAAYAAELARPSQGAGHCHVRDSTSGQQVAAYARPRETTMNTTTTAYEFYCVLGSGEESILAVIEGRGETEADRLRDAESEAAEADIGRGHGPIMVRPAKKVVSDDEYAAARERVSAARATKNAVVEEIRLASIQTSILALYERARSLCGAGRAAWSRVDAARALRSTTWVNQTPEERAEDDALCAAFHAADKAEHDSISDLCAAIRAAAWGQQPDGSFVTRTSVTCGGWQMHHTLHAPCKQGPIVEVRDHERGPGSTLVAFRPLAEAREIRAVQRAAAKTAQAVCPPSNRPPPRTPSRQASASPNGIAISRRASRGPMSSNTAERIPVNDRIFWKLIRSARERRGVSQAELARRVGVTPLSVRGWESGRTSVDEDRMAEVAKALSTTLRELLLVELQSPAPEPLKAGRKPGPAKTTAK